MLEVGGDQASLRATLVALGREVAPAHALSPRPVAGLDDVGPSLREERGEPPFGQGGPAIGLAPPLGDREVREAREVPEEPPEPEPEPEWVTVPLPDGETLIHVARRYLGDGRRWPELLEWNGWSEREARRLKTDQPVKIKRSEMR